MAQYIIVKYRAIYVPVEHRSHEESDGDLTGNLAQCGKYFCIEIMISFLIDDIFTHFFQVLILFQSSIAGNNSAGHCGNYRAKGCHRGRSRQVSTRENMGLGVGVVLGLGGGGVGE